MSKKTFGINKLEIPKDDKWYSWIPTNIGILSFNYIAQKETLEEVFNEKNIDINKTIDSIELTIKRTNLSDINSIVKRILNLEEIYPSAKIKINKKSKYDDKLDKDIIEKFDGNIELYYKVGSVILIKFNANFEIELNGKIVISPIRFIYSDNEKNRVIIEDEKVIYKTSIVAIYTIIKKVVHGDNHHHQKIDTMIGVYKDFSYCQIITDLGFQIKRIEKFVRLNRNNHKNIFNYDISIADKVSDGFISYLETFGDLFKKDECNTHHLKLENIKNLQKSIIASTQIYNKDNDNQLKIFSAIISIIALFMALNIAGNNICSLGEATICNIITNKYISNQDIFLIISIVIVFILYKTNINKYLIYKTRGSIYKNEIYGIKKIHGSNIYSLYEFFIFSKYLNGNIEDDNLNKKNKKILNYRKKFLVILFFTSIILIVVGIKFTFF